MEIRPPRELKIGNIVNETFDVIENCAVPAIIFVLVLAAANSAIAYFGADYTSMTRELAKSAIAFVVGVCAAYALFEVMLRKSGLIERKAEEVILAYAGLSILYTLGVGLGLIIFIFPGLYFLARWSVAQPLLIARGTGIVDAMKQSWERTKGSEFAILVVVALLIVVPVAVSYLVSTGFEADDPLGIVIAQTISAISSMLAIGMGVALYRLIIARQDGITVKTFE